MNDSDSTKYIILAIVVVVGSVYAMSVLDDFENKTKIEKIHSIVPAVIVILVGVFVYSSMLSSSNDGGIDIDPDFLPPPSVGQISIR